MLQNQDRPTYRARNDASYGGELIEPERAIALTDFTAPEISMGERLIRLAYRLGVPGSALVPPSGKKAKLRLLATVTNPLPGDRVSGTALRTGHFLVHGLKIPAAQVDFAGTTPSAPALERVVHGFSWLADLESSTPRNQGATIAEQILVAWLDQNSKLDAKAGKTPGWNVGNTGLRLLNWLVYAPLILSGDKAVRTKTLRAISDTARWLDRNVSHAEDGLAEVTAWCGIVAAGILLPEGKPRRLYGEAGLIKALGELVSEDGGVLSRSPIGQIEAVALLVKLRACYRAIRRDPPNAVEAMINLMVPPLLALVHTDSAIGSWQGGWAVNAEDIAGLVDASGVRTRPLRDVRQWGYQRVLAHRSLLQFDAAPPPMPKHARYGCASTLAFELSHGAHRLIVNCGGAAAAGGLVPLHLEQGLRATAAHSTLTLDNANSTAILGNGAIGVGVSQVDIERRSVESGSASATRLEASHNGYVSRYGLTHRRILIMRDDGTELRGEDMLLPATRKPKHGRVGFAIRFHLGPDVEVGLSDDKQGAGIALPDGSYWQFRATGCDISIEDSLWVDGHGKPTATQQLVLQGFTSLGGGTFSWLLKKMG